MSFLGDRTNETTQLQGQNGKSLKNRHSSLEPPAQALTCATSSPQDTPEVTVKIQNHYRTTITPEILD